MPDDQQARYPHWLIEALVWGEYEDPVTGEHRDAEDITWSRLRARMEHHGNLESGAVSLVLDLERSLLGLYSRHPDAAMAVLGQMFFEPSSTAEMTRVFGDRKNPARLIAKAQAWIHAYLNGKPITAARGKPSCEAAYRRAR